MLSDRDKELIQLAITEAKRQLQNTPLRGHREDSDQHDQAPEVYIVKVPSGGIPAAVEPGTGSAGSGTGTTAEASLQLGSAECDVYNIVSYDAGEYTLEATGQVLTVINFTTATIPAGYITTIRTKFGSWVPVIASGDVCSMLSSVSNYDDTKVQGLVHTAEGECEWMDVVDCSVTVGTGS